jgi:hypothetical protein
MRFIIFPRPTPVDPDTKNAEGSCDFANEAFDEKLFAAYMKYNEDMQRAGVLIASEGLNPNVPARCVSVSKGKRFLLDGPFAESKELVGGFYVIEVPTMDDAIGWAMRCPIGLGHGALEIRQLTAMADLPAALRDLIASAAPAWYATLPKEMLPKETLSKKN